MDIYEQHRQAVKEWRKACDDVEFAEHQRDIAREALDNMSEALLASCAFVTDKPERKTRRKRTPKTPDIWGAGIKPNGAAEHAE